MEQFKESKFSSDNTISRTSDYLLLLYMALLGAVALFWYVALKSFRHDSANTWVFVGRRHVLPFEYLNLNVYF